MDKAATGRASASAMRLVDALFDTPAITIPRAKTLLGLTHRAASLNIDKLVDRGILREVHHGRRPRLFIAPEIMRVVEADASPDSLPA